MSHVFAGRQIFVGNSEADSAKFIPSTTPREIGAVLQQASHTQTRIGPCCVITPEPQLLFSHFVGKLRWITTIAPSYKISLLRPFFKLINNIHDERADALHLITIFSASIYPCNVPHTAAWARLEFNDYYNLQAG